VRIKEGDEWKARKVPFLRVVMGEGKVEMEEKKV